jgi:hypothetical protein
LSLMALPFPQIVLKIIVEGLLAWPDRRTTMPSYKPLVTGTRHGRRSCRSLSNRRRNPAGNNVPQ